MFERKNPSGQIAPGSRRRRLALLGLAALTVAVLAVSWIDPGVLCALPALVLPLLLALRRYPGERILTALSGVRRGRRRRSAPRVPLPICALIPGPRGGLLLARSLADRPPPGVPLAAA